MYVLAAAVTGNMGMGMAAAAAANTPVFAHSLNIPFLLASSLQYSSSSNNSKLLLIHPRISLSLSLSHSHSHPHLSSNSTLTFPRIKQLLAVPAPNPSTATTQEDETPVSHYPANSGWAEFAEKVSGEWDGYGADFSQNGGEPMELPESVVPQAYRDWEVKVFDWQTQCPTLAHPNTPLQLMYRLIRLLPTVGCEADTATTYSSVERNLHLAASAFAYQPDGSYVAVWPKQISSHFNVQQLELEHCLVHPRDKEYRVRIIQAVRIIADQGKLMMQLEGIQVFCEQWYGPFRNGEQLGGCAIRDSAFASTPPLTSCQVTGVWQQGRPAIATFQHHNSHEEEEEELTQKANFQELVEDDDCIPTLLSRDGSNLILLPKQLWCSSNQQEEEDQGETCFQVGWVLEQGLAITSKCSFSADAKLKEIAIACETACRGGDDQLTS